MPEMPQLMPREKQRRRKEVIARKRLERAQDRDGTHVDVRALAAAMCAFVEEEDSPSARGPEEGGQQAAAPDAAAGGSAAGGAEGLEESSSDEGEGWVCVSPVDNCLAEEGRGDGEGGGEGEGGEGAGAGAGPGGEVPLHELSVDELARLIEGVGQGGEELEAADAAGPSLDLPPLSGEHLKAAKRIAGYLRLSWVQKGGGACKVLSLRRDRAAQAPPDLAAVEELLQRLEQTEKGALTKRLLVR